MTEFQGLVALVTSGASGPGAATAGLLRERGARVAVLDRGTEGALAMAADHVQEGIRVNAVAPGTAETPWVGRLLDAAEDLEAAAAALRARQPLGRLVTAPEVAHAVASLASPLAAATTGAVLRVDGGMTSLRGRPRPDHGLGVRRVHPRRRPDHQEHRLRAGLRRPGRRVPGPDDHRPRGMPCSAARPGTCAAGSTGCCPTSTSRAPSSPPTAPAATVQTPRGPARWAPTPDRAATARRSPRPTLPGRRRGVSG